MVLFFYFLFFMVLVERGFLEEKIHIERFRFIEFLRPRSSAPALAYARLPHRLHQSLSILLSSYNLVPQLLLSLTLGFRIGYT